jgi:hypothetical protein
MDGLKTGKLGGALGGVLDHSCPSSAFIYLLALRRDTLYLSFFLSFSKTFLNSHFIATTYEQIKCEIERWICKD